MARRKSSIFQKIVNYQNAKAERERQEQQAEEESHRREQRQKALRVIKKLLGI